MRAGVIEVESRDAPVEVVVGPVPVGRRDRQPIEDAVSATRAGPAVYLVATDDGHDPAYAATRAAGLQLAGATGSRVVLYDRSSESYWTHPYDPNICLSSVAGRGQVLGPQALRRLGYGYLADQLEQARAMGLDAEAALAWGTGPAAMVRCCQQVGVTHVILPATVARPALLDHLLRRRVADFRDRLAGVATVLVGPDEVLRELHAWATPSGRRPWELGGDGQGAELLGRAGRRGPGVPVRFGSVPSGSAPGAAPSGHTGPAISIAVRSSPSPAWPAGRSAVVVNRPISGARP
jgi:hypothetical protein